MQGGWVSHTVRIAIVRRTLALPSTRVDFPRSYLTPISELDRERKDLGSSLSRTFEAIRINSSSEIPRPIVCVAPFCENRKQHPTHSPSPHLLLTISAF